MIDSATEAKRNSNVSTDSASEPWKDKQRMFELYEEKDYTYAEMGDLFGCTASTVSTWMKRHKADEIRDNLDVEIPDGSPYQDRELMKKLYVDEELSTTEIAAVLDCSTGAVCDWLDRHEIDTRDLSEAVSISSGGRNDIYYHTSKTKGYVHIRDRGDKLFVAHRLQAVAYWGFDALEGKHVHHKNGIRWDNRPENLELVDESEHLSMHHSSLTWLDKLRAAEMYRSGASSYDIAPALEVSPGTVIKAVRSVDPELIRTNGGAA